MFILRSVQDAALVDWHHVLYVDEGVFSAVSLEDFEGLLDKVTQVECLALGVVDLIAQVHVLGLVKVEDGEDLSVVGHEGLADGIRAQY
jgi:hypothetical protein